MQHFVSFILIWSLVCISTLLNSFKSRSVRTSCIQQIMSALPHQTATQFQSEVEAKKNTANQFGAVWNNTGAPTRRMFYRLKWFVK